MGKSIPFYDRDTSWCEKRSDEWLKSRYVTLLGKRKGVMLDYGLKEMYLEILREACDPSDQNHEYSRKLVDNMEDEYEPWRFCYLREEWVRDRNWFYKPEVMECVHRTGHLREYEEYDEELRDIHEELFRRELSGFRGKFPEFPRPDPDPSANENDFRLGN